MYANPDQLLYNALARAFAPRKALTVSQWADNERRLSKKGSAEPGPWRTSRNPPLAEPMDCFSQRSTVKDVVIKFPTQMGKSEITANIVGYSMIHNSGPIQVALPSDVLRDLWIQQKLNLLIEETQCVQEVLISSNSRDASNTKYFKDFVGGQIYIDHAGSPDRLKGKSIKIMIVDELDAYALSTRDGDPVALLSDRVGTFQSTYKRLFSSTPLIKNLSRIDNLYLKSDQRKYFMPCPHCNHEILFEWSGLHWENKGETVWYVCPDCGSIIHERQKTDMIANGRWIAQNPESKIRGYTLNCLYYPIGLGPRWSDLVEEWLDAQDDLPSLQRFINSRLAESWEDPAMRALKLNVIAERAEAYPLRLAPQGVCAITAGVDTQDNRLAVQIVGWGKGMACWVLDYVELMGDPADDHVWIALTELLNKPIEHVNGHHLPILATAIDAGGHRTEAVKDFVRKRLIRRPMAIFGAVPNNAPVLSRPKAVDIDHRGRYHKRGITIQHVGTVGIKHMLIGNLSVDSDKPQEARQVHFSDQLPHEYFTGIVSETYDPRANRFIKKRGARNESLDTWVYAFAATHHQELRLQHYTKNRWDELANVKTQSTMPAEITATEPVTSAPKPTNHTQSLIAARQAARRNR